MREVFEEENALDRLETFASLNGPRFYGLPPNEARVTLAPRTVARAAARRRGQPRCCPVSRRRKLALAAGGLNPVLNLQAWNPPKLPHIIRYHGQILASRMARDQHVVGTTCYPGTRQFGPKLRKMGSAANREWQNHKITDELLDSAPIFGLA